jgi:hypothetical protein
MSDLLRDFDGIIDLNAEIAHDGFDFDCQNANSPGRWFEGAEDLR